MTNDQLWSPQTLVRAIPIKVINGYSPEDAYTKFHDDERDRLLLFFFFSFFFFFFPYLIAMFVFSFAFSSLNFKASLDFYLSESDYLFWILGKLPGILVLNFS